LINRDLNGGLRYRNIIDNNGATKVSFLTDEASAFIAAYYTNQGENPLLQLELGSSATEYESYGFKLNSSLLDFKWQSFPLAVINPGSNTTTELQKAFDLSANSIVYISPGNYD